MGSLGRGSLIARVGVDLETFGFLGGGHDFKKRVLSAAALCYFFFLATRISILKSR